MKFNKSLIAIFVILIVAFSSISVIAAEDAEDDNPYHNGAVMNEQEPGSGEDDDNPYHNGAVMNPQEPGSEEDDDNPYHHGALMNPHEPGSTDDSQAAGSSQADSSNKVALSKYPTGNPLVVLLMSLSIIGLGTLRVRK